MTIISLFSGADGMGLGAGQAGYPVTIAIEKEKDPCETIKLNNPDCEVINDTVENAWSTLPKNPFAVIGGPPCQDFSPAKINKTFDLTHVKLFWQIVESLKPKYHLMENVPSLFLKYRKKSSLLLNAADYGTPQTRRRRFWTNIPLPKATHSKYPSNDLLGNPIQKWISVRDALGLDNFILQDSKTTFGIGARNYDINEPSFTILTDFRVWISPTGFKDKNQKIISRSIDEPSQTIVCGNDMQFTNHQVYSLKYLKEKNPSWFDKHPPSHLDEPSRTIQTKDRGQSGIGMITDGKIARKLTNEEVAILQGFPGDYKFIGTMTSIKKQIGNAVPPQISKAFFQEIKNGDNRS